MAGFFLAHKLSGFQTLFPNYLMWWRSTHHLLKFSANDKFCSLINWYQGIWLDMHGEKLISLSQPFLVVLNASEEHLIERTTKWSELNWSRQSLTLSNDGFTQWQLSKLLNCPGVNSVRISSSVQKRIQLEKRNKPSHNSSSRAKYKEILPLRRAFLKCNSHELERRLIFVNPIHS